MNIFIVLAVLYRASMVISNPITPCQLAEPNCVQTVTAALYPKFFEANPELGAETLEPMHQDLIEGNLSILKYKFLDSTVEGFGSCKVVKVVLNGDYTSAHVELICPSIVMRGKYEINGRLIVIPVEGNGDYLIASKKYQVVIDADLKYVTGKDGKTYVSIKSFKAVGTALEPVLIDFKNLFNGQKELADPVLKFANENWLEVTNEVQGPIVKANIKKIVKNANKLLKKMPVEDLILKQ